MSKKFKVKITKCKSRNYWYYDKIGEIISVAKNDLTGSSYIYEHKGKTYLLEVSDCEVIDETVIKMKSTQKQKTENTQTFDELIDMCTRKAFDALLTEGGKGLRGAMAGIYQYMIAWHKDNVEEKK